jgi:hypothetical protein
MAADEHERRRPGEPRNGTRARALINAALLLGLERARLRGLPSGVELERFSPRPLAAEERLAFGVASALAMAGNLEL